MNRTLWAEDAVVLASLLLAGWLYGSVLSRKIREKMDTMRVRRVLSAFALVYVLACSMLVGVGAGLQAGIVARPVASALMGVSALSVFVSLRVFKRLMR